MGSNMAENHPVGFQWVMEARERGAKVIHVDPRFTRTSAMATKHVGIRAGSDIAFLGGIANYILRERPLLQGVRRALHERAGDHRRDVRGHRGPRRALLRLGPGGTRVRDRELDVRGDGVARLGRAARAGLQADQGRSVARRSRRRPQARRAALGGPGDAASALRPPAAQEALRALHARVRGRHLRLPGRGLPRGVRDARRQLGAGADERVLLRGRLDAAHGRCPDDPLGRDRPAAARQHRPARRRDHGAARARVDPGLDRHPDALQHPARLPADAAHRDVRRPRPFHRGEHVAHRLVGPLPRLLGVADEGVLRRERERGQRLPLPSRCRESTTTTPSTGRSGRCSRGR